MCFCHTTQNQVHSSGVGEQKNFCQLGPHLSECHWSMLTRPTILVTSQRSGGSVLDKVMRSIWEFKECLGQDGLETGNSENGRDENLLLELKR